MSMKRKIIIDCDPGADDAIALFLAVASAELEIVGITTVAGNCGLPVVDANARRIVKFLQREDIPVHMGCSRPIMSAERVTTHVHGEDGLAGLDLPASDLPRPSQHAVDFIIEQVTHAPGEITLCVLGPMTNIALATIKEPNLPRLVKEIVFMGGAAFNPGNISPVASFNILADPHAAHIVTSSGARQFMFGLDVTRKLDIRQGLIEKVRQDTDLARAAVTLLTGYGTLDPSLHDPCVILYLIDESLFGGVEGLLTIECSSPLTMGQTVAAVTARNLAGRAPNCTIMREIDSTKANEIIAERLKKLGDMLCPGLEPRPQAPAY